MEPSSGPIHHGRSAGKLANTDYMKSFLLRDAPWRRDTVPTTPSSASAQLLLRNRLRPATTAGSLGSGGDWSRGS